jgi:hypothetical protein
MFGLNSSRVRSSFKMLGHTFMDRAPGRDNLRTTARAASRSGRPPSPCRPSLESLEGRQMMANVAATVLNGNLTLTDNGTTSFTISQPAASQLKITPAAGTTINGHTTPQTISGVTGNLTANLGDGNDSLTFDLTGRNIDIHNVTINGGNGNKTVQTDTAGTDHFLNVHGNYREVLGNATTFESTSLNQFHVDGDMTINHGNGGSFVFLKVDPTNLGTQFNRVGGDLNVSNVTPGGSTATGFDVNALEETNVGNDIHVSMGNASGVGGWTTVGSLSNNHSVTVGDDVSINALTGFLSFGDFANDSMEVRNAQVGGDVVMNLGTGVGNTALFGGGTSAHATNASSVHIVGQGAHDAVTIGTSEVRNDLQVSLIGQGANAISLDKVSVTDDTFLTTFGGGSSIAIDDQAPGSRFGDQTHISMSGGNNFLSTNSKHRTPSTGTTTFNGVVTANLGTSGGNALNLADIGTADFHAPSAFNGGPGINTAIVGSVTGVAPTVFNFA